MEVLWVRVYGHDRRVHCQKAMLLLCALSSHCKKGARAKQEKAAVSLRDISSEIEHCPKYPQFPWPVVVGYCAIFQSGGKPSAASFISVFSTGSADSWKVQLVRKKNSIPL